MNVSALFRNLLGLGDPEIIFLLPFIKRDQIDVDDVESLRTWCVSGLREHLIRPVAASKMALLGLLGKSDVGDPLDLLDDNYVKKFAPASFLKWRILQGDERSIFFFEDDLNHFLSFPVAEKYPPALTAMALKRRDEGFHGEFEARIFEAADCGDPVAMNIAGNILLSSSDSSLWGRGLGMIRASADAGFFLSCVRLDGIYRSGSFGLPVDIEKADFYAAASAPEL